MLRRLSILLVALALLAVAGCGGGDDSASDDTATTEAVAADTTAEETTAEPETDTSDTGAFAWASEDCQNLVRAYAGLSAAIGAVGAGQDVSGDIDAFSEFSDKVPDEIRDDVETIAAAYRDFVSGLEEIGLTAGQTPTADQIQALTAASEALATAEVQSAGERLTTWTTENCS